VQSNVYETNVYFDNFAVVLLYVSTRYIEFLYTMRILKIGAGIAEYLVFFKTFKLKEGRDLYGAGKSVQRNVLEKTIYFDNFTVAL
jgi:hypothetical protein